MIIKYYGVLEITKSTSKNNPFKSDPSSFQKPTHHTKVDHLHQLITLPWNIVITAGLDGVSKDKILTITLSTSKNNISKSKTSRLQNPIQIIKVASCHQLMTQPCQIVTQSTFENIVSKFRTSHLWRPTQMIKVSSWHWLMTLHGRLLWQKVSLQSGQYFASWANHIFITILPIILNISEKIRA